MELPNRITVEPDTIVMRVPARLISAIEAADYSCVTPPCRPGGNTGQAGGHPAPPPPPRQAGGACSTCPRPPAAPGAGASTYESCWIPTSDADLTLDQALRELARPGSEPCASCDARHLPTS
ncbi:hypothetical protein [Streptomyces iranensis]|uniref:Uncharacterized protein n=1 Tax=Streptomyces iranensis TaxID=576784 RepID=A0A061A5Q5_9ACTN|nr:hypothetical protein [Streptomyces iranensis]MBP2067627.1 hypothetical protein [Streptomyces iranensis]CDR18183.1 predicted protein [Streptomyces iranensis]